MILPIRKQTFDSGSSHSGSSASLIPPHVKYKISALCIQTYKFDQIWYNIPFTLTHPDSFPNIFPRFLYIQNLSKLLALMILPHELHFVPYLLTPDKTKFGLSL